MNKFTIRPAEVKDASAMMLLIKELAEFEKSSPEVTVSMEHFIQSGFGAKPVWWALVAEGKEEKVVGMALYYIRYSTWKGERMYLEDIVINKDFKRKGIGKMLMDELITIAKEKGYSGMNWQVLDWNQDAINFYNQYSVSYEDKWLNVGLTFEDEKPK